MNYRIFPPDGIPEFNIEMPLSKSVSNRQLIISTLAHCDLTSVTTANCDDTKALTEALASVGEYINIGGAGTAMRFLTAYFASQPDRTVTLDGDERMQHRPIAPLVDALRKCGADIEYRGQEGYPPLLIKGTTLHGGQLEIDASQSSQFISAILMVAPLMESGLKLQLSAEPSSLPYIDLTIEMMRRNGIDVQRDYLTITVQEGKYKPCAPMTEGDWSAASYWYEIQALSSGFTTLGRLSLDSFQPDRAVARIFAELGVESSPGEEPGSVDLVASPELSPRLNIDLSGTPDLTPAIVVTCALLGVPFNITGLQTLPLKETNRIEALRTEMIKLGVIIDTFIPATMVWDGVRRPIYEMPRFDTYGDHRMAMALAPVSVFIPGIEVNDIEVVAKSYPDFWQHLSSAGFTLADASLPMPQSDDEDTI